jgi:hypothetical protein
MINASLNPQFVINNHRSHLAEKTLPFSTNNLRPDYAMIIRTLAYLILSLIL